MKKILYHGSEFLIEKPEFGKGARHNDYGRGFYCTENIELAREWACAKQKNGYVNSGEGILPRGSYVKLAGFTPVRKGSFPHSINFYLQNSN